MAGYYPSRKFVGHIGDVIAASDTGTAFIVREMSETYLIVEDPVLPTHDFRAVRRNRVTLRGEPSGKYWVIACPHNVPPDRPLPEAASE